MVIWWFKILYESAREMLYRSIYLPSSPTGITPSR